MNKYLPLISLSLMACDPLGMEYVPTNEQIQEWHSAFLIEPILIHGIYANQDVDSVLFSYTSKRKEPISELSKSLTSNQWKIHKSSATEAILYKTFRGLEVVKVGKSDGKICIGWVQADGAISINSQTNETKWANKNFWPKYEQCKNT